jgi:alkylhydroperoxidase family enzyme
VGAHGAVASRELGDTVTEAALADHRAAPLPEKVRAALELLEKVTLTPDEVTADDVRPLKALGVSRQAVEDALLVGYCFNQITRLADAFGFEVVSREAFHASAAMLLSRGYQLPFRTKPSA